jgi:hypothetical protein
VDGFHWLFTYSEPRYETDCFGRPLAGFTTVGGWRPPLEHVGYLSAQFVGPYTPDGSMNRFGHPQAAARRRMMNRNDV